MSLELQQKVYTTHRQGLKPEHVIPAPVKSFSGIRSVWTGEDEKKNPFPLRIDGWGRGETGQAVLLLAPCPSAGHRGLCKPWSYIVASPQAQPHFSYPKRVFRRKMNGKREEFPTPVTKCHRLDRAHRRVLWQVGAGHPIEVSLPPLLAILPSPLSSSNYFKHHLPTPPPSLLPTPSLSP